MISFWYNFIFGYDLHSYFFIGDRVLGNFDFIEGALSDSLTHTVISKLEFCLWLILDFVHDLN